MILYRTVKKQAEAEQIIEKSRFIAHVCPVSSKEEADEFISRIKAEYKDATHNVPAMVIGDKSQIQWASDDGEPQGTSGAPIVQMLVKEGITDVVIVVTRYFGGIKLGTGGLVRAYTGSAKLGLEAAEVPFLSVIVDEGDDNRRTFRIARRKEATGSYAADILRRYGLDRQGLAHRFAHGEGAAV